MESRAAALVAGIIDRIAHRPLGTGRPPMPAVKVVAALRLLDREGVSWRKLRAIVGRVSGSISRRRLDDWPATALLRRAHAAPVRMVCTGAVAAPWDVVVDSRSVRAKRGGALTGPNPTDRARPGPSIMSWSPPTPSRRVWFPRPPTSMTRGSFPICCAWPRPSAPPAAGCTPTRPTTAPTTAPFCRRHGIRPHIRKIGEAHGSGLGRIRCVVEHDCAWMLANKRLDRRWDRLGRIILALWSKFTKRQGCPGRAGILRYGRAGVGT